MEINDDGSIKGRSFSKVRFPYPYPNYGIETYAQYRSRVDAIVKQGFHLGDLLWGSYDVYCKGSGSYVGVDSNDLIK